MIKFYFFVDKQWVDSTLEWFGKKEGKRISSHDENFLLFGTNCAEDCLAASRYICMLAEQINEVEKQYIHCCSRWWASKVWIWAAAKWHETFSLYFGKLPVGSTYLAICRYIIHKNDFSHVRTGEFGTGPSCQWKQWKWNFRLKVAAAVEKEIRTNSNYFKGRNFEKENNTIYCKSKVQTGVDATPW